MPERDERPVDVAAAGWALRSLTGFGRGRAARQLVARPERIAEIAVALPPPEGRSLVARGGGQSYGDAAQNDAGAALETGKLDRLLAFDPQTGVVEAEAGAALGDLLATFLPRGYAVAALPGSPHATLGGAIATDAHGKDSRRAGSFARHVAWVDVRLADGRRVRAAPGGSEEAAALFAATAGGMGLTGTIERAALRLAPAPSPWLRVRREARASVDGALQALDRAADEADFAYAWLDGAAGARGRAVVVSARWEPAAGARRWAPAAPRAIPPSLATLGAPFAPLGARAFNLAMRGGAERVVGADRFFFPLARVEGWPRLFGRRGLTQIQVSIPREESPRALDRLLDAAQKIGGAWLASLRALGPEGPGLLSFVAPGWALALDFPARRITPEAAVRFERIAIEHGCRVNLAKDSTLSASAVEQLYPGLPRLRAALDRFDPEQLWQSDLSRRLRLRDYAI